MPGSAKSRPGHSPSSTCCAQATCMKWSFSKPLKAARRKTKASRPTAHDARRIDRGVEVNAPILASPASEPPRMPTLAGTHWPRRRRVHSPVPPADSVKLEGIVSSETDKMYSGENFRGPDHASPYPVSRLGAPVSLVDTAQFIESASSKIA